MQEPTTKINNLLYGIYHERYYKSNKGNQTLGKYARSLDELLLERIKKSLHKYYPDQDPDHNTIESIPNSYRSANIFFLYRIEFRQTNVIKIIAVKVCLPFVEDYIEICRNEYKMLTLLQSNKKIQKSNYYIPNLLDYFEDFNAIVMEKIEATQIVDYIKDLKPFQKDKHINHVLSIMQQCGQCLRFIHQIIHKETQINVSELFFSETYNDVKRYLRYLASHGLIPNSFAHQIHDLYLAVFKKYSKFTSHLVIAHGDFHVGNIMINEDKIYVIDFPFSKENIIYEDIGCFLTSLMVLYLHPRYFQYRARLMPLMQERFLIGYFGEESLRISDNIFIQLNIMTQILFNWQKRHAYIKAANFSLKRIIRLFSLNRIYEWNTKQTSKTLQKLLTTQD
ncbi:MAG: phosphotransferase [Chlamydiota bacterium]|nr:phosphotransferase [Chlamydiota bacterium]